MGRELDELNALLEEMDEPATCLEELERADIPADELPGEERNPAD